MRGAMLVLVLGLAVGAAWGQGKEGGVIRNAHTVVSAATAGGRCLGFDVSALDGGQVTKVAEVRWTSSGRWTCQNAGAVVGGKRPTLTFSGFEASSTVTPTLGAKTQVTVSLEGDDPYPHVSFTVEATAFDEAAWRKAWQTLCPVYFLRCSLPDAADQGQMFYQGGELYPGPRIDPYPITMGPMKGDWSDNWSYAPALGAAPIPAVGLWSPASRLFVAYEFQAPRSSDQSDYRIASAYCAGKPDHPGQFLCLAYPAASGWLHLRLPSEPFTIGTRFRLLYNRAMPSDDDPNRWVIRELLATYRDALPPAPRMNDMAWVRQGREASQLLFLHDLGEKVDYPKQNVAPMLYRDWEECEKPFFQAGSAQLAAHQTGKASQYAWVVGDEAGLAAQKQQLDALMAKANREHFGDDTCFVWEHPLAGSFKPGLGGDAATGTRHMFNWGIASAMLHFYRNRRTTEYLPYLDGMVKWTRHYLYDRAGMADLPWAVFSMGAANGGEFLLDYYYTFRSDPERGALAQEAFRLAEVVVYRNIYYYTSDPDRGDTLDPTFLLQAVNSHYWLGQVTWGEMGRIPEMCIQMYLETGDPFFEYLARGTLEHFYVGTVSAAGNYTENMSIYGETGPKGGTSGGWGANNFRWLAEPLGSAIAQVDVGPKGAMVFCRGTRAIDLADYAFRPESNFGFTVKVDESGLAAPKGVFDIQVTAPRHSLKDARVTVNGQALPADRSVIGTAGTDMLVRGVKGGDRVAIGEVGEKDLVGLQHYKLRGAFDPEPSQDFECLDLTKLTTAPVDNTWAGPWGGLIPGPGSANGVPYALLDPDANRGLAALDLGRNPTITIDRPGPLVLLWGLPKGPAARFGPTVLGRAEVTYADGKAESSEVRLEDAAEAAHGMEWYDKSWVLVQVPVGSSDARIREVRLSGEGLLFAVTASREGSEPGKQGVVVMRRSAEDRRRLTSYQAYATPISAASVEGEWSDPKLPYRALLALDAGDRPRRDALIRVREAFDALLEQIGAPPFAPGAVRVWEIDAAGKPVREVLAQFEPGHPTPARGELLLKVPGDWPGGEKRFYVYFSDQPVQRGASGLQCQVTPGSVAFTSGPAAGVFELSGSGSGPRLMDLRFGTGPNLLAKAGWDEGFGHLCACQDGVTWYDFSALQGTNAKAQVVSQGPLALTFRVTGLRLFGAGAAQPMQGVGTPGRAGAAPKGDSEWYFRLYAGDPRIDSWVEAMVFDPDTRWTRPLDARFGTASKAGARTVGQGAVQGTFAEAGGLVLVALDDDASRPNVRPYFTNEDGAVLDVSIGAVTSAGPFRSDRWRMMPSGSPDAWYQQQGAPVGVTQYAVEHLENGRVVRPQPKAVEIHEVAERIDWNRLLPYERLVSLTAGQTDAVKGLTSQDNRDEGTSLRKEVEGRWAIVPGPSPQGGEQAFFYFHVDDPRMKNLPSARALIAVEYHDLGRGTIALQYDSTDLTVHAAPQVPGAFKEALGKIQLQDSHQWRTYVFSVPDARFNNGCNGADFRLEAQAASMAISRVAVGLP